MKTQRCISILALLMALIFSITSCNKTVDETTLNISPTQDQGAQKPVAPNKLPYVTTTDVTGNNTGTSIVCGGTVTLGGGSPPVTERGVVWSSFHAPRLDTCKSLKVEGGTGTFSVTIEGLTKDAVYFVAAYAKNSAGTNYGSEKVISVTSGSSSGSCPSSFVDSRDGKTYKAVQIGDQCWMAENLNVGTRIDGGVNATNNAVIEKYCYNNIEANCNVYGGLYQWDEMMAYSAPSIINPSGVQGICPEGWHLPSFSEISQLTNEVGQSTGGGKLKETGFKYWLKPNTGATDEYGFSSLGSGNYFTTHSFGNLNDMANYWTTTFFYYFKDPNKTFAWTLMHTNMGAGQSHSYRDVDMASYSVRCIKDGGVNP